MSPYTWKQLKANNTKLWRCKNPLSALACDLVKRVGSRGLGNMLIVRIVHCYPECDSDLQASVMG